MDINKIAELSMVSIKDGGLKDAIELQQELENIIESVRLPEIDDKVRLDKDNAMLLRPDQEKESLPREKTLMNAPQKQAGCFVVPKTVGEN